MIHVLFYLEYYNSELICKNGPKKFFYDPWCIVWCYILLSGCPPSFLQIQRKLENGAIVHRYPAVFILFSHSSAYIIKNDIFFFNWFGCNLREVCLLFLADKPIATKFCWLKCWVLKLTFNAAIFQLYFIHMSQ